MRKSSSSTCQPTSAGLAVSQSRSSSRSSHSRCSRAHGDCSGPSSSCLHHQPTSLCRCATGLAALPKSSRSLSPLAQNPPAIPTLAIVKLAALLRGSRVIIDWHNTGYSVLALRLGPTHPVVRFARLCAASSTSCVCFVSQR